MNVAERYYLVESIKSAIEVATANKKRAAEAANDPTVTPGSDYHTGRLLDIQVASGQVVAYREILRLIEALD